MKAGKDFARLDVIGNFRGRIVPGDLNEAPEHEKTTVIQLREFGSLGTGLEPFGICPMFLINDKKHLGAQNCEFQETAFGVQVVAIQAILEGTPLLADYGDVYGTLHEDKILEEPDQQNVQ